MPVAPETSDAILRSLIHTISETNGVSLSDTLDLILNGQLKQENAQAWNLIQEFNSLLDQFRINQIGIQSLLQHPVHDCLAEFLRRFPLPYYEEHIHLTGALTAEFLWPRLKKLFAGPNAAAYEAKIKEVYGNLAWPIRSAEDVDNLIRLKEGEGFATYLRILYLPKLILVDREAHAASAYHMAHELFHRYNVGHIRLKFMLSRATSVASEQIPGQENLTSEDVVLGLAEGFRRFQKEQPRFDFVLSPSFRKEKNYFDSNRFSSRKEFFEDQVNQIVSLLDRHPDLQDCLTDVDTVGNESELYRKEHFMELQKGFRKLQYRGLKIRSHHGETFHTLKKGIQAVDNAMNIWHIDTLEHGLSLGINPNYYFHRLFQRAMERNDSGEGIAPNHLEHRELTELDWGASKSVLNKLLAGVPLQEEERTLFVKAKFHTAREVETYQHDVLNRLIQKGVSLISLPSSNNKLTGQLDDYKDHPFSWWEKKGVVLGVGTDNYVTLNTNYLQEMLILLYTDPVDLKITKLLMVTTRETRRPFISHLLWKMRKSTALNP